MTIEDIILDRDRRGISKLRQYLPADFCDQAAALILEHPGTAFIVTGFYILDSGADETDGPPGAIVIGNALETLGYDVVYVTDKYCTAILEGTKTPKAKVVDFPITDDDSSKKFAIDLLAEHSPSVVISIERCGFTDAGEFLNMRGRSITDHNAKTDHLFTNHPHTVGIGDGGNEIGLGNVAKEVTTVDSLVKIPCITSVSKLILSSVSNWGGYGLVASLSKLKGKDLLPSIEEHEALIRRTVDLGGVDGMSGKQEYKVDSFSLEENNQTINELRELLTKEGVS